MSYCSSARMYDSVFSSDKRSKQVQLTYTSHRSGPKFFKQQSAWPTALLMFSHSPIAGGKFKSLGRRTSKEVYERSFNRDYSDVFENSTEYRRKRPEILAEESPDATLATPAQKKAIHSFLAGAKNHSVLSDFQSHGKSGKLLKSAKSNAASIRNRSPTLSTVNYRGEISFVPDSQPKKEGLEQFCVNNSMLVTEARTTKRDRLHNAAKMTADLVVSENNANEIEEMTESFLENKKKPKKATGEDLAQKFSGQSNLITTGIRKVGSKSKPKTNAASKTEVCSSNGNIFDLLSPSPKYPSLSTFKTPMKTTPLSTVCSSKIQKPLLNSGVQKRRFAYEPVVSVAPPSSGSSSNKKLATVKNAASKDISFSKATDQRKPKATTASDCSIERILSLNKKPKYISSPSPLKNKSNSNKNVSPADTLFSFSPTPQPTAITKQMKLKEKRDGVVVPERSQDSVTGSSGTQHAVGAELCDLWGSCSSLNSSKTTTSTATTKPSPVIVQDVLKFQRFKATVKQTSSSNKSATSPCATQDAALMDGLFPISLGSIVESTTDEVQVVGAVGFDDDFILEADQTSLCCGRDSAIKLEDKLKTQKTEVASIYEFSLSPPQAQPLRPVNTKKAGIVAVKNRRHCSKATKLGSTKDHAVKSPPVSKKKSTKLSTQRAANEKRKMEEERERSTAVIDKINALGSVQELEELSRQFSENLTQDIADRTAVQSSQNSSKSNSSVNSAIVTELFLNGVDYMKDGKWLAEENEECLSDEVEKLQTTGHLTADHLNFLIRQEFPNLLAISRGKKPSERHNVYYSGIPREKGELNFRIPFGHFRSEQLNLINELLMALFREAGEAKVGASYLMMVILPEVLISIYQMIHGLENRKQADDEACSTHYSANVNTFDWI